MATEKTGLSYYNTDTDRFLDIRIKRLKKRFGCNGYAVYTYLLNEVYRVRGCVLLWDEATLFDTAEYWGLSESEVEEIVGFCGEIGLFSKNHLEKGIITSEAIQKRYLNMCARAKRKSVIIPEEWRIITEECEIIPEECEIIPEVCDKEKKSKINNNNLSLSLSLQAERKEEEGGLTTAERERIFEVFYFDRNLTTAKEEAEKFINYYEANGWCRGNSSKRVKNKASLAKSWRVEREEKKYPDDLLQWLTHIYKVFKKNNMGAEQLLGIDFRKVLDGYSLIVDKELATKIDMITSIVTPTFDKLFYLIKKQH